MQKMQDGKMQKGKLKDQLSRLQNAGQEFEAPNIRPQKCIFLQQLSNKVNQSLQCVPIFSSTTIFSATTRVAPAAVCFL